MSTSRHSSLWAMALLGGGLVLGVASVANCSAPTNCLRFSDCGDGLTCAYGKCVPPPIALPDGGGEGGVSIPPEDAGGSTPPADASGRDAARDAAGDASAPETGSDDASPEAEAGDDATAD